jgi:hypothetical protein
MVDFCLHPSQNPFDSTHSLSISNFGHFPLSNSSELGHYSYSPCRWLQVLGNSSKHGEAWVIVGGGQYPVE